MTIKSSELLDLSPLGILICDGAGRIKFANNTFSIHTGLAKETVEGQLFVALPFESIDKKGFQLQQFDDSKNNSARYQYWQTPSRSNDQVIHYFILDRESITKASLLSRTKLPKRPSWVEFLDYEVSRSRRYDNPLCILKLQIQVTNNPDKLDDEAICQSIKDTLMDSLRWADMISSTKQGSFMMVLPETPDSSIEQLECKLSKSITAQLKYLSSDFDCQIVFGHSAWKKHDDSQTLLTRARKELVKNLEKKTNTN